jgi:hypothetical protein
MVAETNSSLFTPRGRNFSRPPVGRRTFRCPEPPHDARFHTGAALLLALETDDASEEGNSATGRMRLHHCCLPASSILTAIGDPTREDKVKGGLGRERDNCNVEKNGYKGNKRKMKRINNK